jgi:hypothetical protein
MEKSKGDLNGRMSKLLGELEKQVAATAKKATVSDYIRLIQFGRELEEDAPPSEVKITWIDRVEKFDSGR